MAVKTVTVITDVCVRCGGSTGPEVIPGDTVKLWLDQEAIPAFPEWVEGTIITVEPQTTSSTAPKYYKVQYESGDLDDAAAELRGCDVVSVTCVGCCVIINDYLDLMAGVNIPHVSLSYSWNNDGTVTLQAHAYSTQIAGNPGEQVTIASYVFKDLADSTIAEGGDPDSRVYTPAANWEGGKFSVLVTDSEGLTNTTEVWVYPRRTVRYYDGTIGTGATSMTFTLASGEVVFGAPAVMTAGAGVLVESVVQSGTTVTVQFTNNPNLTTTVRLPVQKF